MMKISIIVPIYNCEKYLAKCLDSIIRQDYSNLEVILINDGSSDNSKSICEEFCKKDKRFILINKKNEGVSEARNTGLDIASGEYIIFIDADDWIEPNMCKVLLDSLNSNEADMVFCNHIYEFMNKSIKVNFACEENIVVNEDIKKDIILPLVERDENDIKYIIESTGEKMCIDCAMRNFCWKDYLQATYKNGYEMINLIEKKGTLH